MNRNTAWNKFDYEFVKEQFELKNLTLISKEYTDSHTPLEYICNKHPDRGVQKIKFVDIRRRPNATCAYCMIENGNPPNHLPEDYVKEIVSQHGWQYVGSYYKNGTLKIQYICNEHAFAGVQETSFAYIKNGSKVCSYCNGTHRDTEYFKQQVAKILPNIRIHNEYNGCRTRMECTCEKHPNFSWKSYAYNLLSGYGCPLCGNESIGEKKAKPQSEMLNEILRCHDDIEVLELPNRAYGDVKCKCKKCGEIWEAPYQNLVNKYLLTGCPRCKESKGEKKINQILQENGVEYQRQKRFDDCKDIHVLPFDFYIPKYNIAIEYQGEQHYEKDRLMFGNKNDYDKIHLHDLIKSEYCKKNNIKLIAVPYWEFDNMERLILSEIKKMVV